MKIICIAKGTDPRCLDGIATFERVLGKIFKDNIKFYVYNTDREYVFDCKNIINIEETNSLIEKILLKILGRTRYTSFKVKRENPDVVIINKPKDLRMLKGGNFKKVLVQHIDLESYKNNLFKSSKLIELIQKELDYYVFLSDKSKEIFLDFLKLDKNKGITIRHSCEMELLDQVKTKNRKLVIISRLDNKQKRIDLAIRAMKKLPEFTLDIYGDGADKKILKKIVIEEGLEERVFFRERTNQVKEKLDEAGIFIMTSDYEGYGITNIEAMMRGLPIILRNTFESAPDIVKDNGILLDKEWDEDKFVEAVYKVYENYDYYSKNAIEMGKRHTFEIIKNEWWEFINRIRAESREQRAESREQRAESREQRAESREQRAESREQRAESREQRAVNSNIFKSNYKVKKVA